MPSLVWGGWRQSGRFLVRARCMVALRLVRHKGNPAVPDELDTGNHVFRLCARQSNRDGTLLDAGDPIGRVQGINFFGDLGSILAVFGFDLALVLLHELGCGAAKRDDEVRRHALLNQRLPGLFDDLKLLEQPLSFSVGDVESDLDLAQSGKCRLIVGALRTRWRKGQGKKRDRQASSNLDAALFFSPSVFRLFRVRPLFFSIARQ